MFGRSINQLLDKLKARLVTDLEKRVDNLAAELEMAQNETNRLVRELIVEQRLREDRDLSGNTFHISDKEVATRIFNDLIMYLDPRDIAVVPHIILEGIWEKQITQTWLAVLQQRDAIVFDIGANFGYFGMLAAQVLDRKKAKVVLFEANPELLPYIHKNLSVNWLNENSIVEGIAISDVNGTAQLNVLEDYTGSSSMHDIKYLDTYLSHKMHIKADKVIEVPTTTIDDYCQKRGIKRIDVMKMDIEGYEEKAYHGMVKMVKISPNMILFIEFTKDGYARPEQFYKQMLADFGTVYTIGPKGELVAPKDTSYKSVIGGAEDWIMLVFSKQRLPHIKQQDLNA